MRGHIRQQLIMSFQWRGTKTKKIEALPEVTKLRNHTKLKKKSRVWEWVRSAWGSIIGTRGWRTRARFMYGHLRKVPHLTNDIYTVNILTSEACRISWWSAAPARQLLRCRSFVVTCWWWWATGRCSHLNYHRLYVSLITPINQQQRAFQPDKNIPLFLFQSN